MGNIPPDEKDAFGVQVTRGEALSSIWQWRKYRNQAFWGVFYRFGILVIGLTLVPYLFPGLIQKLGWIILVFPCIAYVFRMSSSLWTIPALLEISLILTLPWFIA